MSFLLEGFPRWDRIEAQIRFFSFAAGVYGSLSPLPSAKLHLPTDWWSRARGHPGRPPAVTVPGCGHVDHVHGVQRPRLPLHSPTGFVVADGAVRGPRDRR